MSDDDPAGTKADGVTPKAFKNYKPSILEARGLERSDTTTWRTRMQMSKLKFDDKAKARYLDHLSRTGRKSHAAAYAGVCPHTVVEHRKNDPTFDEAVNLALAMYADDVQAHAMKLASGVKEPIIGGPNKDQIVGYKMVYAIPVVLAEMKRVNPEYRDKSEIDIKGSGGALVVPAGLTPAEWLAQMQSHNAKHDKEPGADE